MGLLGKNAPQQHGVHRNFNITRAYKLVTLAITFADTEEARIKIGFDLALILVSTTNPILLTETDIECGLKKPTKTYY